MAAFLRQAPRMLAIAALTVASFSLTGAAPLDVLKVRVPAAKVGDWFPRGTELRSLSPDEFDVLIREANAGLSATGARPVVSLARADHAARWDGGILVGRTILTLNRNRPGSGWLALGGWSPAVYVADPRQSSVARAFRSDESGRAGLWIEPDSPLTIAIDWRLRARNNSDGRAFSLVLPDASLSSLRLDLPSNFVPDLNSAISIGPAPALNGRRIWQFDRIAGAHEIRLRDVVTRSDRPEAKPWVGGTTLVEINHAGASWTADWSVDLGSDGPRSMDIDLDEGLELIDAIGPRVASFEAGRVEGHLRVSVKFLSSSNGQETLRLVCAAKVPGTGPWKVPAARPIGAIWLGGRTTIRSDLSRNLSGCRVQSGSIVTPGLPPSPAFPIVLAIEPTDSVSVAELTFQKPEGGSRASVVGLIRFASETTRMLAQVRWTLQSGTVPNYVLELSNGWAITRVELDGEDEPIPWRSEPLSGGRTRVTLTAPPLDEQTQSATFNIQASTRIDDPSAPFDLPRIRPVGSLLEDERWVGITRDDQVLRPTFVQSIAWLLPDVVLGTAPKLAAGVEKNIHATAWRWLGDDAEARARIVPLVATTTTRVESRVGLTRDRVELVWQIDAPKDSSKDGFIVQIEPALTADPVWTRTNDPQRRVEAEPLPGLAKIALGLRPQGSAYRLRDPGTSALSVTGRASERFSEKGPVPLLVIPPGVRGESHLEVLVAPSQLARFEPTDLRPVDLDELKVFPASASDDAFADFRLASAFTSDAHNGRLQADLTSGAPSSASGLIREAFLSSMIEPGRRRRNRLFLQVSPGQADRLDLTLPAGLLLSRVARDGQVIEVTRDADRVAIPLGNAAGLRSITLDYESDRAGKDRVAPFLPIPSLPCASFSWEVLTPDHWIVDAPTGGLRSVDESRSDRFSLAGWWNGRGKRSEVSEASSTISESPGVETSLADWLVRPTGEGKAVVVDRLALLEVGAGPQTRVQALGGKGDRETLSALGLRRIELTNAILIASARGPTLDRDGEPNGFTLRIDEALKSGADRDDRFQTVERWRGEATPRGFRSIGSETWTEGEDASTNWRTSRFVGAEWPRESSSVRLRNSRHEAAWSLVLTCLGFALTILVLSVLVGRRRAAFLSIAAITIGMAWSLNSRIPGGLAAWLVGTILGLAFRYGSLRSVRPLSLRRQLSRSRSAAALDVLSTQTAAPLVIGLLFLGGSSVAQESTIRILALLPYEQIPTPGEKPGRIFIRLEDDKKLRALVDSARTAGSPQMSVIDALHRVSRDSDGMATISSRYDVAIHGVGTASWRFPVGESVEMSATIDGKEAAVSISTDRREASTQLTGPGLRSVQIVRRIPLRETKGRSSLDLPVLSVPSARLTIAADGRRRSIDVPSAHGRLMTTNAGVEGELGPSDRILLRWSEVAPAPPPNRGELEAIMLWDAVPSGDLARIRVTVKDPLGTDSLRLALEPGDSVRPSGIPGLVGIKLEGTPDRPEWVARMDPPLPAGAVLELKLWRPIGQANATVASGVGDAPRSLPRFIPLGVDRLVGIVGLRRPGAWVGRLQPKGPADGFSEESFASLWGAFPDDSLTLAGASRFDLDSLVSIPLGPPSLRLQTRSTLDLVLGEGRIELTLDSRLQTTAPNLTEAELILPEGFSTLAAEADGITSRSTKTPGRLGLRFDGKPARVRQVRVRGFFDVSGVVASTEIRRYVKNVGILQWAGATSTPTLLRVASRANFEVTSAAGPPLSLPAGGSAVSDPVLPIQRVWQLDPMTSQLNVRWQAPSPRVTVRVRSRLSIGQDRADWLAKLNYDIAGGPLESVYLKIPKAWSDQFRVEALGDAITTTKETKGDFVYLTVKPEGSAWGVLRLELSGTRTLESATSTFDYPDVTPLGQGVVDKTVAVIRGNQRRLQILANGGLVPLDGKSPGDPEMESLPVGDGRKLNAYRVQREPWTLSMKIDPEESPGTSRAIARVKQAILLVTRLDDGSTWGKATYDLEPISNRVLKVEFNTKVILPWAVVDGRPVIPLSDEPGSWLIPIEGPTLGRVSLAWRSEATNEAPDAIRFVAMPKLRQPGVPTLLSIASPESGMPRPANASLEAIGETAWWVDLAEGQARELASQASLLNRGPSSLRDTFQEALVDYLASDGQARLTSRVGGNPESKVVADRLDESRSSLLETLERLGLTDLGTEAMRRAGLGKSSPPTARTPIREASEPFRLRQVGEVRRYRLRERGDIVLPLVLWQPTPASSWWLNLELATAFFLWTTTAGLLSLVTVASSAIRSRGATTLALAAFVVGLLIRPVGSVAGLSLYLFGRWSRR